MDVIREQVDTRLLYKSRQAAIAHLLKRLREERDLKQTDIGQVTGFSQSAISKLESGERSIKFVEVDMYARALGLEVGPFAKAMFETMWQDDDPALFGTGRPGA